MKKLEPKQVPQFAALCILSAGTFGYFVVRLVTPSPAAAGTHLPVATAAAVPATAGASAKTVAPAGAAPTAGTAVGSAGTTEAGATAAPEEAPAPPPAPTMRDPFAVSYVVPKTAPAVLAPLPAPPALPAPKPGKPASRLASLPPAPVSMPAVPPLPGGLIDFRVRPAGLARLPEAPKAPALPPPAPAWTVTGVLQGEAEQVAILRDGEARRIVRTGDAVDGLYKVVDVTRSTVTLRHGKIFYRLTLGAVKAAPVAVSPATLLPPPAPAAPSFAAPDPLSYVPARPRHGRRPPVSLAQAGRSLLKMARSIVSPGEASVLPPVLEHARQPDRTQADLRFLDDTEPTAAGSAQLTPDATDPIDRRQAVASSDAANPAD